MKSLFIMWVLLLPALLNSQNLKTYTVKMGADDVTGLVNVPMANDFGLKVNGQDVFVYNSRKEGSLMAVFLKRVKRG